MSTIKDSKIKMMEHSAKLYGEIEKPPLYEWFLVIIFRLYI
ncbi:hypothetical protein B4118_3962 [Bacillus cereus]|nr:hypothetical protein B4118_3962 [Bacillus cereus]QBZ26509.1 hypothetical protein FORC085_3455 [Bacillus cereus]